MRSLHLTLLAFSIATLAPGCAGLRPSPSRTAANIECAGGLECLPDDGPVRSGQTPRMARGRSLAATSFEMPPPPSPNAPGSTGIVDFWDSLDRWIERRADAVEAARLQLDEAAEENHRQRIVGGAIVGLMYEDVARELSEIPAPRELDTEPEIQHVYRATLDGRARTFVERARRAYSACAQNAVAPDDMRGWSYFCAAREDALPERAYLDGGLASGETVVEVIADR